MPKLYWGHYETSHFDFDAFGKTKEECLSNLINGWRKHCKEYTVDVGYLIETVNTIKDEFYPMLVSEGICLRDKDDFYKSRKKVSKL